MQPHIEVSERETTGCPDCSGQRVVYTGEVVRDDALMGVFSASLYDHPGNPEVFIDLTLGTWEPDGYCADHVTFGSRTGAVEEHPHIASTLVTGAEVFADDPMFGVKLTREQALKHPRLDEFWRLNDEILELPEVVRLLTGRRKLPRWPSRPLLSWPRSD